MKMREAEVVSPSVSRTQASTPQESASVASRCANSLATLRSCLDSSLLGGKGGEGGGGREEEGLAVR